MSCPLSWYPLASRLKHKAIANTKRVRGHRDARTMLHGGMCRGPQSRPHCANAIDAQIDAQSQTTYDAHNVWELLFPRLFPVPRPARDLPPRYGGKIQ
jgi:hypothetical protein